MSTLVVRAVVVGLTMMVLLPATVLASVGGSGTPCLPAASVSVTAHLSGSPAFDPWATEQRAAASVIIAVGDAESVPAQGIVIALATAMQESGLRNLPGGDADSIGVFQQRPSQGWGTPVQLASPEYQARQFFRVLQTVPDWQRLSLAQAAQVVQRSARPDAYARWAAPATALLHQIGSPAARATRGALEDSGSLDGCVPGGTGLPGGNQTALPVGFTVPSGTPAPAATAILWALGQLGTPYSYGGDCTAPRSGDPARQCDCASLVQQAFKTAGVSLPRTTFTQVRQGSPVPDLAASQPGDLVFIPGAGGDPVTPGHVGLVIGQGLLVEAPHSGAVVRITPLREWIGKVSAVRRVVP